MKTTRQFLELIDYMLYSRHITKKTLKSQDNMHKIIIHLSIKDEIGLNNLIDKTFTQIEQEKSLLTHRGLINILSNKYPEILLDFVQTEKARRYIGY